MSQRPGEGAGQRPGVGALLRRLGESAGYLSGARHPVRRLTEDGGQPSATEPQERRPGRDSSAGSAAGVPKARIYDREAGRYITEVAPSAGVLRFLYSGTRAGEAGRSFANRPGLSRAAMAAARLPGSARAIDGFAARHGIDLRECEETSWPNFAAFFTRRLKPSARPIDQAEDALVAPADSRLLAVPITPGLRLDIKGTQYTLPDLTGPSVPASDFEGGWCLVFRLAIEDCHRFISVDNATVTSRWRARGRLDTVGPASRDLPVLATNSRIVTMLDGANLGAFCLVAVGAMMVGSIHLSSSARHRRGQEAGYFDLGGSTLVLLVRPGLCQPAPDILDASRRGIETRVKLGSRIATVHPSKSPPHPAADAVPNLVWSSGTTPASSGGVLSAGVVGAKAAVLGALAGGGLPVPGFVAVTTSAMARALDSCRTELEAALAEGDVQVAAAGAAEASQGLRAGADLEEALASHLSADITYAVRSSALDEDGTETSAAGRYLTHLDVPADQVADAVVEVWKSAFTPQGLAGRTGPECAPAVPLMGVIVQPMASAQMSGVAFTVNPTGPLDEAVVNIGHGAGAVVADSDLVTTVFVCRQPGRDEPIITKHAPPGAPQITPDQVKRVVALAEQAARVVGCEADVEFAIGGEGEITVLQARPITTLTRGRSVRGRGGAVGSGVGVGDATGSGGTGRRSGEGAGNGRVEGAAGGTVLDDSNIQESYPGVTGAATASFAQEVYHRVFRAMAQRLAGPGTARARDGDLSRMVAWWGGRMYYQINNWYALLTLLPFSRTVVRVWQDMLGVTSRDYATQPPADAGWVTKLRLWGRLLRCTAQAPKLVDQLHQRFGQVEAEFRRRAAGGLDGGRTGELYRWLAAELAPRWDVTLLNDAYVFAFTGALTWCASRSGVADPAGAARLTAAHGAELVSLEPLRARQALAEAIRADSALAERLAGLDGDAAVRSWLATSRQGNEAILASQINAFIDRYGDRATGELKLETPTYRSHPSLLVKALLDDATAAPTPRGGPPEVVRCGAADGGGTASAGGWSGVSGTVGRWLGVRARRGMAAREVSRLDRSRLFGMVRELALARGAELTRLGRIERPEDFAHLTMDELFFDAGGSGDLRPLVRRRAAEREAYAALPAYHRIRFSGPPLPRPALGAAISQPKADDDGWMVGTGCSPGVAEGPVLVVRGGVTAAQVQGRILVAEATEPGWVFCLPHAAGVVSEKGSLLSHTAIVARELGVPLVVGVSDVVQRLSDGETVRIDGGAGTVERVRGEDL